MSAKTLGDYIWARSIGGITQTGMVELCPDELLRAVYIDWRIERARIEADRERLVQEQE